MVPRTTTEGDGLTARGLLIAPVANSVPDSTIYAVAERGEVRGDSVSSCYGDARSIPEGLEPWASTMTTWSRPSNATV